MRIKTPESTRPDGRPADSDTVSTEQPHGAVEPGKTAQRQNSRMPHERDESASATGNRLDEDPTPSDLQISKAHEDIEAGRVDTDRRGVPDDIPKSS